MHFVVKFDKNQGSPRGNSRGKNTVVFHGNWGLFRFPRTYRARGPTRTIPEEILISLPTQMVPMEILISRSHRNDSREIVCFPAFFRSCAVKSCGNIDFANPVRTKTVLKKVIPAGIIPTCLACTGSPNGNSTYVFICLSTGGMVSDRSRVFDILQYVVCAGILVFFVWRVRIVIMSCFRKGGCCVCRGASWVFSRSGLGCRPPSVDVSDLE